MSRDAIERNQGMKPSGRRLSIITELARAGKRSLVV
jgi:hypothetical protein